MNCTELCKQLVKQKDSAHVCLKDSLPYILQLSAKKIEAIERGFGSFNVNDMMLYILMCKASLILTGQEYWMINDVDDLRECIKRERESAGISSRQLAKSVKVPMTVIEAFENRDGGLRIESFLDIINALEIEIQFE